MYYSFYFINVRFLELKPKMYSFIFVLFREYAGNLGDEEEDHEKKIEQEYLLNLVNKF